MTVHIALLRAVNLAGSSAVAMSDLRSLMTELGFEAKTLLQSGNLVFDAGKKKGAALETSIEKALAGRLSLKTEIFLRTAKEWDALVEANPFPKEAKADPGHLVLITLREKAKPADVKTLQASIKGRETVAAAGRELYVVYPDGIGRSKLTMAAIEKALGTRGTGRNWNTVLKIAALAAELLR
jgi:uncharacterized protein (DUF1697 family)